MKPERKSRRFAMLPPGWEVPKRADREPPDMGEVPFQLKAEAGNDGSRMFTGLASTWDMDLQGDVIHQGAFEETLNNWRRQEKIVPLVDSHAAGVSVLTTVGKMIEAEETDEGLLVKFEMANHQAADDVWSLIQDDMVGGLSIGYRAIDYDVPTREEMDRGIMRHLKEIDLREISVVQFPANTGTRINRDSLKANTERLEDAEDLEMVAAAIRDGKATEGSRATLHRLGQKYGRLLTDEGARPPQEQMADPKAAEDLARKIDRLYATGLATRLEAAQHSGRAVLTGI
jgi:HK97 family phage prohead protease